MKEESREIQDIPPAELDKFIATYLIDIRPPDSRKLEYEPETLISKYYNISTYLKERNYSEYIQTSDKFHHAHEVLKANRKNLKSTATGTRNERQIIS